MQIIGIIKEPEIETRVCFVPKQVQEAVSRLGLQVIVETGAGDRAGFHDGQYLDAGASIAERSDVLSKADTFLFINSFYEGEDLNAEKNMIGILNPLYYKELISNYRNDSLNLYSLDLLPRSSIAQSMDVLSSMSSLSGYMAVIKASEIFGSTLPMFTTAAGTIYPAKVLVLGAGVAGLQAIATAKRLGAVVEAFDVRKSAGEEVRSLGAKFVEVQGSIENEDSGGYAVEQTEEYKVKQQELLAQHIAAADIVICTANIPGKRSPLLINKQMLDKMKPMSVIIDMASAQGGNCELSVDEKLVVYKDVKILGNSFLSREVSHAASQMLSSNYFSFIRHFLKMKEEDKQDDILTYTQLIGKGNILHQLLKTQ